MNAIPYLGASISLFVSSALFGEGMTFKDIEKIGRSTDGTYLVLCKDGSTENGLSLDDLYRGNVCPSKTAPSYPFVSFRSISAGGDSCTISTFENLKIKTYRLGKEIAVNDKSESDSQACMTFTEYGVADRHRIAFKKLKYTIENMTSDKSEYTIAVSANDVVHEVKIPSTAKKSLEIELPKDSYTNCASGPLGTQNIQLYTVLTRITGAPNEGVKITKFTIEDFRVEKC